jgi:Cof subfamily protein (haloacid dehalogenase superfamily)
VGDKFGNILLVSDIDGTLVDGTFTISEKNKSAVAYFLENGGKMVLATGRSKINARKFYNGLSLTMPCVLLNGAAVYDFEREEYLWRCMIDVPDAIPLLKTILESHPDVGIEVWGDGEVFQLNPEYQDPMREYLEEMQFKGASLDMLPKKCFKILVSGAADTIAKVWKLCRESAPRSIHSVCSSENYCEMISADANKFSALLALTELTGTQSRRTAAIGDYYNDIEMVKGADIGAAPSNAVEEVQAAADVHFCNCSDGAVAEFIDYLEKNT